MKSYYLIRRKFLLQGFLGGSVVKNPPVNTRDGSSIPRSGRSFGEVETHSSILAWEISWIEDLVGYSPWGCKRVGHDLVAKQ